MQCSVVEDNMTRAVCGCRGIESNGWIDNGDVKRTECEIWVARQGKGGSLSNAEGGCSRKREAKEEEEDGWCEGEKEDGGDGCSMMVD